jgi:transposase
VSSNMPVRPNEDGHPAAVAGEVVVAVDPSALPFRRSFTAAYRARLVAEYEAAEHGHKAAVLRREGLYQSQVGRWASARDALARGSSPPRRAHRASGSAVGSGAGTEDVGRLRSENQRLARELAKSQEVVEIMGYADVLIMPMFA